MQAFWLVLGAASVVFAAMPSLAAEEEGPRSEDDVVLFEGPIRIDTLSSVPELSADMYRSPGNVSPTGPEDDSGTLAAQQVTAAVSNYRENLQSLELQDGPWGEEMPPELMRLGDALQQQGEHEQAVDKFSRAAHVLRINEGLDTLEQIPAVRERIESHVALEQWEEADELQQYALYVHRRNMGDDNVELVPELRRSARWNVATFYRGFGEQPLARLLDAYEQYSMAYKLVEESQSLDDPRRPELLNRIAGTAYMLARQNISDRPEAYRSSAGSFNGREVADLGRSSSIPSTTGYSRGEQALKAVVELYESPELSHVDDRSRRRAEALARLGDWYLLFNRRGAARDTYRRAWDALAENDEEAAAELFSEVVFLPSFPTFGEQQRDVVDDRAARDEPLQLGYLDMRFDVTRYGSTRRVELVNVEPGEETRWATDIIRNMRRSTLRPRLEDGEMVRTEAVTFRFPYWYQPPAGP